MFNWFKTWQAKRTAEKLCKSFGHKRGKAWRGTGPIAHYSCGRCGATWTRKIRKAKS